VIRALFCVFAGVPVLTEKRAGHCKHQHTLETAVTVEDAVGDDDV
jgi:hypothetical protein